MQSERSLNDFFYQNILPIYFILREGNPSFPDIEKHSSHGDHPQRSDRYALPLQPETKELQPVFITLYQLVDDRYFFKECHSWRSGRMNSSFFTKGLFQQQVAQKMTTLLIFKFNDP